MVHLVCFRERESFGWEREREIGNQEEKEKEEEGEERKKKKKRKWGKREWKRFKSISVIIL